MSNNSHVAKKTSQREELFSLQFSSFFLRASVPSLPIKSLWYKQINKKKNHIIKLQKQLEIYYLILNLCKWRHLGSCFQKRKASCKFSSDITKKDFVFFFSLIISQKFPVSKSIFIKLHTIRCLPTFCIYLRCV